MAIAHRRPPLGQHFLKSSSILDRIARAVEAAAVDSELIIEIGAGNGELTCRLLGQGRRVLAIEIDARLAGEVQAKLRQEHSLEVLRADVLELDLRKLIAARTAQPAVVTGNLPYYITSPILRGIFDAGEVIAQAVLLMQREVAARVVARSGGRQYGFLSLLCQAHSRPELLFTAPPGAFRPAPRVTSALVRFPIEPRLKQCGVADRRAFLEFGQLCFQHKRKTLRNNLAGRFGKERLAGCPQARLRAEQLGLEGLAELWLRLADPGRSAAGRAGSSAAPEA